MGLVYIMMKSVPTPDVGRRGSETNYLSFNHHLTTLSCAPSEEEDDGAAAGAVGGVGGGAGWRKKALFGHSDDVGFSRYIFRDNVPLCNNFRSEDGDNKNLSPERTASPATPYRPRNAINIPPSESFSFGAGNNPTPILRGTDGIVLTTDDGRYSDARSVFSSSTTAVTANSHMNDEGVVQRCHHWTGGAPWSSPERTRPNNNKTSALTESALVLRRGATTTGSDAKTITPPPPCAEIENLEAENLDLRLTNGRIHGLVDDLIATILTLTANVDDDEEEEADDDLILPFADEATENRKCERSGPSRTNRRSVPRRNAVSLVNPTTTSTCSHPSSPTPPSLKLTEHLLASKHLDDRIAFLKRKLSEQNRRWEADKARVAHLKFRIAKSERRWRRENDNLRSSVRCLKFENERLLLVQNEKTTESRSARRRARRRVVDSSSKQKLQGREGRNVEEENSIPSMEEGDVGSSESSKGGRSTERTQLSSSSSSDGSSSAGARVPAGVRVVDCQCRNLVRQTILTSQRYCDAADNRSRELEEYVVELKTQLATARSQADTALFHVRRIEEERDGLRVRLEGMIVERA